MRRLASSLTLGLLAVFLGVFPARAQTAEPPVVHAILFWMNGCPHCHEVLENVLPPLQAQYGAQLEILMVEVVSMDDVNRLYEVAAAYDIPRERTGVPFMIVGDHVLIGSRQIPDELPDLIERYLAQGGVERPVISNLADFPSQTTPTPLLTPTPSGAVVRVTLFTTLECRNCQAIEAQGLRPLKEQYGDQLEIQIIEVATLADVEYLYLVAAGYGCPKEEVDLPLLIIGDLVLMVEEIPAQLPALVEFYLAQGGVDFPSLPSRSDASASSPTPNLPAVTETPLPADTTPNHIQSNGFTLAILIMVGMAVALIYSLIAFAMGKTFSLPVWGEWLIPALIVVGIGVAAYLSYVEMQSVEAVCGPIGDCNTVQQSRYATLFGFLPVGVLGLLGYLGLLAAWLVRRFIPKLEKPAAITFWGMAVFAVIFSLYLTYLEPFVIRAVCIWCLTSAVIVTLLLLLGTPPAVLHFAISDEDE